MHSENLFFIGMSSVYLGIKLLRGSVDILNIISLFTSMSSITIVNIFLFYKILGKQNFIILN